MKTIKDSISSYAILLTLFGVMIWYLLNLYLGYSLNIFVIGTVIILIIGTTIKFGLDKIEKNERFLEKFSKRHKKIILITGIIILFVVMFPLFTYLLEDRKKVIEIYIYTIFTNLITFCVIIMAKKLV